MDSGVVIYIPRFIKIGFRGSNVQGGGGDETQNGDRLRLFLCLNKKSGAMRRRKEDDLHLLMMAASTTEILK
jgi:hypothetical protein